MKKHRYIKWMIILAILCALVFACMVIYWSNNSPHIPSGSPAPVFLKFGVLFGITLLSLIGMISIPIALIAIASMEHTAKKCRKKVQDTLSTEFSEVKLKTRLSSCFDIPKESIHCMAKLDENNNIIYQIKVDFESSTQNADTFLDIFEI